MTPDTTSKPQTTSALAPPRAARVHSITGGRFRFHAARAVIDSILSMSEPSPGQVSAARDVVLEVLGVRVDPTPDEPMTSAYSRPWSSPLGEAIYGGPQGVCDPEHGCGQRPSEATEPLRLSAEERARLPPLGDVAPDAPMVLATGVSERAREPLPTTRAMAREAFAGRDARSFHLRDGWLFTRLDDASVVITKTRDDLVYEQEVVGADDWVSIVQMVSDLGPGSGALDQNRRELARIHKGPASTPLDRATRALEGAVARLEVGVARKLDWADALASSIIDPLGVKDRSLAVAAIAKVAAALRGVAGEA